MTFVDPMTLLVTSYVVPSAVLAFTERPEEAARLLGAAEALRESLGVALAPAEQTTHDETVDAVRSSLDEDRFSAAWLRGREMPLDDAVAHALEEETAHIEG